MSDEREDAPGGSGSGSAGAWKDFVSSALLIAAVAAILVMGYVLRGGDPTDEGGATVADPPVILLGSTITPEPAPPAAAAPATTEVATTAVEPPVETSDPVFERLASRAASDVERLGAAKGGWTAQLLVACRVDTVDRVLAAGKGAGKLYVLPAELHGDACFRICWGAYPSAKDAALASDLPRALRGKDKIAAVAIAKVLR